MFLSKLFYSFRFQEMMLTKSFDGKDRNMHIPKLLFLGKNKVPFLTSYFFLILCSLFTNKIEGQVTISSVNTFVTTSWDGWNGTNPTGFTRTGANYVGTTANITGGLYAITSSGLGYQPSGTSPAGSMTTTGTFQNTTGATQTSVTIEYEAFNIVNRTSRLPGWTVTSSLGSVSSLDWAYNASSSNTSPDIRTITLTGLSIANNSTFTVTWASDRGSGSGSSPLIGLRNVKVKFNTSSCTTPIMLTFQTQPSNVLQDATMSPSVQVAAVCSGGAVATAYTGNVTLTVNAPGCGYTSQTVACVNGVATFSSIVFTRSPQSNLTFTATASGLTSATSTSFNVSAPAGAPIVSTIIENNFDATQTWAYSVGTPIAIGSSGSAGTDVVGIVTEAGTGVLRKSYSVDNGSGEQGSKNTVTFNNVTGLASYSLVDFTFNVLSFGTGSGAGNDSGEDFQVDVSTDNGASWTAILIKKGYSNCTFASASTPQTTLSLSALSTYTTGSCDSKSAFKLSLNGISQFRFRFTAQNNRTNENWAIDNAKLTGTSYGTGVAFNLPTVDVGSDILFCSGNSTQLSASVSSYQPSLTYAWTPSTGLSAVNIANPTVSGLSTAQTYTLQITDGNNCVSSDQINVTPQFPPSIVLISPP